MGALVPFTILLIVSAMLLWSDKNAFHYRWVRYMRRRKAYAEFKRLQPTPIYFSHLPDLCLGVAVAILVGTVIAIGLDVIS